MMITPNILASISDCRTSNRGNVKWNSKCNSIKHSTVSSSHAQTLKKKDKQTMIRAQ